MPDEQHLVAIDGIKAFEALAKKYRPFAQWTFEKCSII